MDVVEFHVLVEDCLEESLTEADAARLSAILEQSAEARRIYWEAASVHGLLEHALQNTSAMALSGRALSLRYFLQVCSSGEYCEVAGLFGRPRLWMQRSWRRILTGLRTISARH
jgi:hypothetical protein